MRRTFFAVVTAVVLVTAVPAFAVDHSPNYQTAGQAVANATSGGAVLAVFGSAAQPATVPNEMFATGEVVMVTPGEVVLHTAKGMQKFAISQQTDESTVPVEGQMVTVGYVPERGAVQILASQPMSAQAPTRVADATTAPAAEPPSQNTMTAAEPDEPTAAAASAPAVAPAMMTGTHRMTRLPKTASNRPLILVAGLLAVAAAGTLRLALRA
jgi:hypothetical protein